MKIQLTFDGHGLNDATVPHKERFATLSDSYKNTAHGEAIAHHIVACVDAISAASEYSVRNGGNPLRDPGDLVQWTESTFALHSEMRRQQDRAEGLAAENARLREALRPFVQLFERIGGENRTADSRVEFKIIEVIPFYTAARAALAGTK